MKHGVKKIKFASAKGSNKILIRKLTAGFLSHGYIKTTLVKGKILKSKVESLVTKMKVKNQANRNILQSFLNDRKLVDDCFETVGPALDKVSGGYVRIIKLGQRNSDGSEMAKIEWAYPVVRITEKPEIKKGPATVKTAAAKTKNEKTNKTD